MRKSRHIRKENGGNLNVHERSKKEKQAGSQKAAREAHHAAESDADDIELDFTEEPTEKLVSPRKSPKKSREQTAGSPGSKQARERLRKHPDRSSRHHTGQQLQPDIITAQRRAQPKNDPSPSAAREPLIMSNSSPDGAATAQETLLPPAQPLTVEGLNMGLPPTLQSLRRRLLDVAGGRVDEMALRPSLQHVQDKLVTLLSGTVDVPGENNSLLLVGPRGVGKTLVVERAGAILTAKYNKDDEQPRIGFVKLTGLAHADERAAFREIARQLCLIFHCQYLKQASLEDNLGFLRNMLKELCKSHKVVVFVLDEFDLFARRAKQSLLYNLFDAMQEANMQAGIVGLSCRSDVTEMLEKRVKSRFSYRRQLVLDPSTACDGQHKEQPAAILRAMLSLEGTAKSSSAQSHFAAHFNAAVQLALQDSRVLAQLQHLCDKGYGCPRELGNIAMQALCQMAVAESLLSPQHLLTAIKAQATAQDSQAEAVSGLAILELFLLVALHRLRRKGQEAPNFEMAFDEYSGLQRGGSWRGVDTTAPRPTAFRAFERLLTATLLAYSDGRAEGRAGLREFYPVTLLLTEQELEEGLQRHPNCPPVLPEWLKRDALATHAADE